jgi:hypothetical protein
MGGADEQGNGLMPHTMIDPMTVAHVASKALLSITLIASATQLLLGMRKQNSPRVLLSASRHALLLLLCTILWQGIQFGISAIDHLYPVGIVLVTLRIAFSVFVVWMWVHIRVSLFVLPDEFSDGTPPRTQEPTDKGTA